jgi:hypothetical protein
VSEWLVPLYKLTYSLPRRASLALQARFLGEVQLLKELGLDRVPGDLAVEVVSLLVKARRCACAVPSFCAEIAWDPSRFGDDGGHRLVVSEVAAVLCLQLE